MLKIETLYVFAVFFYKLQSSEKNITVTTEINCESTILIFVVNNLLVITLTRFIGLNTLFFICK